MSFQPEYTIPKEEQQLAIINGIQNNLMLMFDKITRLEQEVKELKETVNEMAEKLANS